MEPRTLSLSARPSLVSASEPSNLDLQKTAPKSSTSVLDQDFDYCHIKVLNMDDQVPESPRFATGSSLRFPTQDRQVSGSQTGPPPRRRPSVWPPNPLNGNRGHHLASSELLNTRMATKRGFSAPDGLEDGAARWYHATEGNIDICSSKTPVTTAPKPANRRPEVTCVEGWQISFRHGRLVGCFPVLPWTCAAASTPAHSGIRVPGP